MMELKPFENLEILLKVMSPKRFEILKALAEHKDGLSIRKLATILCRDYKNVHHDVSKLNNICLIARNTKSGKIYTPHVQFVSRFILSE